MPEERLQKIISRAGVASRRAAEQMILDGRVIVNGHIVSELGSKADLERDHIKVDGKLLRPPRRHIYIALNKPREVVTTASDPQKRETVIDIVRGLKERLYPVGRLDYHSEGLLLLTNDGEFANRITSARYHVPKTYLVKVTGYLSMEQEEKFRAGVPLHGRKTSPAGLKVVRRAGNPWYEVLLQEGRNHQVRDMFKHFGLLVEKLRRTRIAFLDLGALKPREFRELTPHEVERFRKLLKLEQET
jgi:23S rRNA pseudouridine2605 synthase